MVFAWDKGALREVARAASDLLSRPADRTAETAIENGVLSFRVTAPWAPKSASGALQPNGRRWEGVAEVETGCGWRKVAFVATPR